MRLEQSSLSAEAADIVLKVDRFDSGLLSEGELLNLARFPTRDDSQEQLGNESNPRVSRTLQGNAVALAQAATAIATERGLSGLDSLGEDSFGAIARLVGQETFLHDANVKALVAGGAQSIIDSLVAGPMASVPFVGAAASLLWNIGITIFKANGRESSLPPMLRLNPDGDNRATRDAVAILKDEEFNDWTPIFLPTTRGLWGLRPEEGGTHLSARQPAGEYAPDVWRLGCAPGDLFYVDAGFQSRITKGDVTIPSNARKPKYRNFLQTGDNPDAMHRLAFPLSEWFPSLSALGRSVWSLVGTRESVAMFQVDALKVAGEWDEFADSTASFRQLMDEQLDKRVANYGKDYKRGVIARNLGNYAAALHTLRHRTSNDKLRELSRDELLAAALDPAKRAGADSVGRQAVKHAKHLHTRQIQAAKTPLNALVSKNAPALRNNPDLRETFMRHRTAQLDAGKFDGLSLDDVPDARLRERILERTSPSVRTGAPTGFADPGKVEQQRRIAKEVQWSLESIDRPLGFGGYGAEQDPDDETGGGYGLAIAGLVATAGLAAGGVALARRRRK